MRPGADCELQRRAAACQLLQERDGFRLVAARMVVEALGDLFVEAEYGLVALHEPIVVTTWTHRRD